MPKNYLSQETEIDLIIQLSPYLSNKFFLDIGAEKGEFSQIMLEQGMGGILFEPLPRHHAELKKLINQYKNATFHKYAITDIDTTATFYVATDDDGNELDYFHSLQKASAPGVFSHSIAFDVECRSLHSLSSEGFICHEIGILKTDTEGNDLKVLRGLGDLRPEIIICEYFTQGLYDGWIESDPTLIIQYMRKLGYLNFFVTKRTNNMEFVGINTEVYQKKQWGNLFFFREDFYAKAHLETANFILNNEREIQCKFENLLLELEKKEKVIQQLLSERKIPVE